MWQIIIIAGVAWFGYRVWKRQEQKRQLAFIESYTFPSMLLERVKKQHDYLSDEDLEKVVEATKDYFYICNLAKGKMVAMPSEIVDVLWHEFILFTRAYEKFTKQALGRFLHHVPTEAMEDPKKAQEGIKRAWRIACAKEEIDPSYPQKLPRLFAIDKQLGIKGGFMHELNCSYNKSSANKSDGYCGSHIACASGCAGESGASSADGFFSGSDGDGGGSSCSSCSGCGGS